MGKLSSVLKSIDMAKEARMARAKEMGFSDETYYHGTGTDFESFNKGERETSRGGLGVYLAKDPKKANLAAKIRGMQGGDPSVIPVNIKSENPFILDPDSMAVYTGVDAKKLEAEGYTGVRFVDKEGNTTEETVFDPKNIRSTQAAFDPAKKESSNLLAGQAGIAGAVGLGAATQSQEAEANVRDKVKSYVTKRAVRGGRDKTLAESALSILEPAAVIGSSYARDVAAGLGGIVAGIDPYSPRGSGAAMIKHLQKRLPIYTPRTQAGQQGLETLGGAIESGTQRVMQSPAGPYIEQAGQNFQQSADYLAEEVHPAAGAALKALPELL